MTKGVAVDLQKRITVLVFRSVCDMICQLLTRRSLARDAVDLGNMTVAKTGCALPLERTVTKIVVKLNDVYTAFCDLLDVIDNNYVRPNPKRRLDED